ncbi:MAG: hypothetical protein C4617_04265 [Candidatus Liberibacter europaeus]|uniref:Uncharacterized protein n=1 Tax=Candidatus Liberibacter europaeus TaxID=744859 RepID=A0A2T4VXD1_9HYPH|nr:hypothetical protein [Candidatus Liberibacter europaeus]PTL86418.1 MAG: hypothetical protein C4617_04265 [Candidatus Liberibacter europaeus]
MFFIIKKIFWISMFLFVLSNVYPNSKSTQIKPNDNVQSEIKDIINITSSTFNYASNVCNAQPDTCVLWRKVLSNFKKHTTRGAKIAYEFIKSSIASSEKSLEPNKNNSLK